MAKSFNDVLKEFSKNGGVDAASGVLTDSITAIGSNAKYKGAMTGRAVGGGIGTAAGALIGMPGVGKAVGSLIGGMIGGKSDENHMINDQESISRKKYSKLNLASNVDPYGSDNLQYMEDGGMVDGMLEGGDENGGEGDPKPKTYRRAAPEELTQWNNIAKYVQEKGYTKDPRIDAKDGSFSKSLFEEYRKVDPSFKLQYGDVGMIQNEFQLEKQFGARMLAKKDPEAAKTYGANYSPVDEFAGSKTFSQVFPDMSLTQLHNNQVVSQQNLGLVNGTGQSQAGNFTPKRPLPPGVKLEKMADGHYYYEDPQTGDLVMHMKSGGMIPKMEYGGASDPDAGGQEEEKSMVNIEKGELLIDPTTLEVVRDYDNPNRYAAHQKNSMKEPVGNFTMINKGHVVIPKKYAKRFKYGDELARQSIVAEILKNQANDPDAGSRPAAVPQAAEGMLVGGDPVRDPLNINYKKLTNVMAGKSPLGLDYGQVANFMTAPTDDQIQLAASGPQLATGARVAGGMTVEGVDLENTGNPSPGAGIVKKGGINKNILSSQIVNAIPTAFGITNAMGVDPFLRYDENTQTDQAKAYAQGMETSPNIEAAKAAIRRTNAGRNKTLNNFNSPATRTEVAANNVAGLKAEADLIGNASNIAMDARNRKRQTLGALEESQGQSRLNMREKLRNEMRQDKANRENLIHQGLSEAATNYSSEVMDQERIKALNTMATYYGLDPYGADLLEDKGAYMDRVMEAVGGMKGFTGRTGAKGKTTQVASTTRDRVGNVKSTKQTVIKKD